MKLKSAVIAVLVMSSVAANSFAMMGGGPGSGPGTGTMGGGTMGGASMLRGPGTGMAGAGGMKSLMLGRTMSGGYLDVLTPFVTPQDAITAVENFISTARSSLQISDVWEYQSVYKVELVDTAGQKAFDVLADKLTGTVTPEMGFSLMMNASWGKQLMMTPKFAKKPVVTPEAAATAVTAFIAKNAGVINYTIAAPEVYPGYYKFHTTDASGNPGMDIMVNGYSGRIWMNTQLGAPIGKIQ